MNYVRSEDLNDAGGVRRGSVPSLVCVSAKDLMGQAFPPVRWVVPELVPDGLTMLAGKPKVGKSWLMLNMALAVASGGFVLDQKCEQGAVLYLALEDNQRRLQDRIRRCCPFQEKPEALDLCTSMLPLDQGGTDQIGEWITRAHNPRLVVVDVFGKVRRRRGTQEGLYDADYLSAMPLKSLSDSAGVGIALVHHLNKQSHDVDPLDGVSGSTGLTGAMDTILALTRGVEGVTLHVSGRDVETRDLAVRFDGETYRWSLMGDAAEFRMSEERRAIVAALRGESEPLGPTEITDVTGHKAGATRKLLHHMVKSGEVQREGRGKYKLSDSHPREHW